MTLNPLLLFISAPFTVLPFSLISFIYLSTLSLVCILDSSFSVKRC